MYTRMPERLRAIFYKNGYDRSSSDDEEHDHDLPEMVSTLSVVPEVENELDGAQEEDNSEEENESSGEAPSDGGWPQVKIVIYDPPPAPAVVQEERSREVLPYADLTDDEDEFDEDSDYKDGYERR